MRDRINEAVVLFVASYFSDEKDCVQDDAGHQRHEEDRKREVETGGDGQRDPHRADHDGASRERAGHGRYRILVAERIVRYASMVGRENVMAGVDRGFGAFAR